MAAMLFEQRFVEGIEAGKVTLTFRRWKRPAAKAGSRHRIFGRALIEIDAVELLGAEQIDTRDANAAGFRDAAELEAYLRGGPSREDTRLYRVEFHYVGPLQEPVIDGRELPAIVARLEKMDRLSKYGPWTGATLATIAERPRTLAARLAQSLGRETAPFKADVRKLKYLGLTRSLEVGYELTEAGERALAMLQQPAS
jgi:hypothetical protein